MYHARNYNCDCDCVHCTDGNCYHCTDDRDYGDDLRYDDPYYDDPYYDEIVDLNYNKDYNGYLDEIDSQDTFKDDLDKESYFEDDSL